MVCEGLKESCYKLDESYSYGGVKVSTGFMIDTSACPGFRWPGKKSEKNNC